MALLTMCFWAEASPRSMERSRRNLSGSIAVGEEKVNIRMGYSLPDDAILESGLGLALERASVGSLYFRMDSKDYVAFLGTGKANEGAALKTKPYSEPQASSRGLWLAGDGEKGDALLFGFGTEGIALFVLTEPSILEANDMAKASSIAATLDRSFRSAGIEFSAGREPFSVAISASLSDKPSEASGDGWRAGTFYSPGSASFAVSSSARLRLGDFKAGAWMSGSVGYLEPPGLAASLDWAFGRKLGGGGPSSPSISIGAFVFGSAKSYRTASGEPPLHDFLADARASFSADPWTIAARFMVGSFLEGTFPSGKRPVLGDDVSPMSELLWLWRTDLVRAAIDLGYDAIRLAARFSVDGGGPRNASLVLSRNPVPGGTRRLVFKAAAKASFSRSREEGGNDEEASDEGEDLADSEGLSFGDWLTQGLDGDLRFRSAGGECGLQWMGSRLRRWLEGGSAKIGVSVKNVDRKYSFFVSGELVQKLLLFTNWELSLAVKSPEGGYALDRMPDRLPCLKMEFVIAGR
ncbi:MAG TPA: hypothetical protein VN445_08190 [Rectinemataceae bacterium]|nr:hypothetical protein [Rectinemataceae bacterium]